MEGQKDSFAPPRFFQEGRLPLLPPRIRRPCPAPVSEKWCHHLNSQNKFPRHKQNKIFKCVLKLFSFCEWRNNSCNTYQCLTLFAQFFLAQIFCAGRTSCLPAPVQMLFRQDLTDWKCSFCMDKQNKYYKLRKKGNIHFSDPVPRPASPCPVPPCGDPVWPRLCAADADLDPGSGQARPRRLPSADVWRHQSRDAGPGDLWRHPRQSHTGRGRRPAHGSGQTQGGGAVFDNCFSVRRGMQILWQYFDVRWKNKVKIMNSPLLKMLLSIHQIIFYHWNKKQMSKAAMTTRQHSLTAISSWYFVS